MFIKKNTRRALLVSIMSLILCCAMLMGTTFAWFTDSVTSGNNIIKSGTLDVEMYWADGTAAVPAKDSADWIQVGSDADQPIFSYTLWEPGYTQVRHIKIVNNGNLALNYQMKIVANGAVSNLADVIDVYYTTSAQQIAARADMAAMTKMSSLSAALSNLSQTVNGSLLAGAETTLTLALKMQETAGNEYQNKSIGSDFSIILYATQMNYEEDSFGSDYDGTVPQPVQVAGSAAVDTTNTAVEEYEIPLTYTNSTGTQTKSGSVTVPREAIKEGETNISASVAQISLDSTVPVEAGKTATTFNINVNGLKEGNTKIIEVEFYTETGLTNVRVFHKNQPMDAADYSYDPTSGKVLVKSASFSPFTLVYDDIPVEDEKPTLSNVPVAIVTDANEFESTEIAWAGYGGYNPVDMTQQLETAYKFKAPHTSETVLDCAYKNWYCDYYVKFVPAAGSNMTTLPKNTLTLGGNYEGYGWVGFANPEVSVDTEIPLLGSVLETENGWTYEMIVDGVNTFWCGVAKSNGSNLDLNGAKFIVELRLTNPADENDSIAVNTVTYTFGETFGAGQSEIVNYGA